MHRLTLVSIGKVKTVWIEEGCSLYRDRLKHTCAFSEHIIPAGNEKEEHKKMLSYIEQSSDFCIALDERGALKTSQELSLLITQKRDEGRHITLCIGGAYGLSDAIRKEADLVLSLSPLTFPHELAKLLTLEQLFRAESIRTGSGYHH
jgi:23S rRNA (pseudouridine1915-N3)-methyltransferase